MRWIKSPAWDLVWVLNALWLAPLVLLLARGHGDVRASPVDGMFFVLAVPLWFGHRVASAWLAYATPAYRPLLTTQRLRFVVAPLVIAASCFALLLTPESVLPMPLTERVVWLAVLDYLLVSHHFAAQHFGLLSLYRVRAERAPDRIARRLDRWFALVVGGGFVVLAEALAGSIAFQDRWIDPLLGASVSESLARTLHDGGIAVVVILTALVLGVELRAQRPSLPRVAYVLGVSAMVLVAFLARDPFLFIVLWSVQHWSAAMGLASLAASGGTEASAASWQRRLAPINQRGWAVLLVLAVVSALLLPVLEVQAVSDDYVYADRLFGAAAWWLRSSPLVPALLALGFATGFIHYLLDRATFRFSSPDVRQAARGLLVLVIAIVAVACSRDSPTPAGGDLGPGAFHVKDLGSADAGSRYLATTGETPPVCQFEVAIEPAKPAGGAPFSFSKAALIRRPASDCTRFLERLATRLAFTGDLPRPAPVDRLATSIAILGTNQSRSPEHGEIAASFSSTPPGSWTASKLFLADGEGEVFLNINARDGIGEFSIKDEEYATVVVTELARILLP